MKSQHLFKNSKMFSWNMGLRVFIIVASSFFLNVRAQQMNYALQDVGTDQSFNDGLAVFMGENYLFGAIDTRGKIAIQPQFKYLSDFSNGSAVVQTENGWGVINRKGDFILKPQYDNITNSDLKHPDVYIVHQNGATGVFYNGRTVLPVENKDVYTSNFPFITYKDNKNEEKSINVYTGEVFDGSYSHGNYYRCYKRDKSYYYTGNGEQLSIETLKKSKYGVYPFREISSGLYGFKNSEGKILIDPTYSHIADSIWIDERMIVERKDLKAVVSAKGKVILTNNNGNRYDSDGKYIWEEDDKNLALTLYDENGHKLLKTTGDGAINMGHKDWFRIDQEDDSEIICDAMRKKLYKVKGGHYHNGMIEIEKGENDYYFIDAESGKQIPGSFKSVWPFHEGLAVVKRHGSEFEEVIDKSGRVIYKENERLRFSSTSPFFSEGVMGINENYTTYNYIYNPLGNENYSYNQANYTDRTIENWNKLGHEAFAKKQYATAKDYYYRVMMNKPNDVNAIINYGAALGNMGYYDEALESCRIALDIDPDNQLAKDNLRINIDNKQKEEARLQAKEEEEETRATKSSTFWDALGNFANILSSVAGGTSVYQPYSSFSMDMDYSPSLPATGSNYDYQSEYNRWANLAERHYNSLTNLGYRVKHNDGRRSGGTLSSMSGSKYVQMKKSLRDAQHEMQRIRRKASQNGVAITPSTWETATVGY